MALGQDVSSIEAVLNSVGASLSGHPNSVQQREIQKGNVILGAKTSTSHIPFNVGSRLAQGCAADLDALCEDTELLCSHSYSSHPDPGAQNGFSSKRKRARTISDVEQQTGYELRGRRYQKGGSRDLMPPPPIPIQQPYVFAARIPNEDINEIISSNDENCRSRSGRAPVTPEHEGNPSGLARQLMQLRGNLPPTPSVEANNRGNPSPYGLSPPSRQILAARGPSPGHGFPPSVLARYNGESGNNSSLDPSSSMPTVGNSAHPHAREEDDRSLSFPFEPDHRRIYSNGQLNRSASRLGLSGNARSSISQTGRSPSHQNSHRRPLGREPSESPHFPLYRLSNGNFFPVQRPTSASRANSYSSSTTTLVGSRERDSLIRARERPAESRHSRNYINDLGAPINSYSSTTATLVGSQERDNLFRAQEYPAEPERGRNHVTDPGAQNVRRPDQSRGRLPTADAEASSQRRRANR